MAVNAIDVVEELKYNIPIHKEYIFGPENQNFVSETEYNDLFVKAIIHMCNDLLKARHTLFLNDVLDKLGLERTQSGALLGWFWHEDTHESEVKYHRDVLPDGSFELRFLTDGYIIDHLPV